MSDVTSPTRPGRASGRRRRDPVGTRDRLVRAALELFTTQGYHPSTTPQIAVRAGVAEGTIYRHFASKSHLLNEIFRGGIDLFRRVIAEGPGGIPCRQRLDRIADQWVAVAARDPHLVRLVMVDPPLAELDAKSRTARNALRADIESVLASGKASGEVRAGPVDVWVDVWLQLVRLALDRVSAGSWSPGQTATRDVLGSAWDAVRAESAT